MRGAIHGSIVGTLRGGHFHAHAYNRAWPFAYADGRIRGVFRGLVTNAEAVKKQLGAPTPCSLPELISLAYLHWGAELNAHVLGQFCGVVFDGTSQRLTLFQDSLGLGALYFRSEHDGLSFATSFMDLRSGTSAADDLDPSYFATYLELGGSFCDLSPVRGVRRLVHGGSLVHESGRVHMVRGWHPNLSGRKLDDASMEEAFRACLDDELKGISAHATRLWCEVSGGLDSTSLYYQLREHRRDVGALSVISGSRADDGDTAILRELEPDLNPSWVTVDADRHIAFSKVDGLAHLSSQLPLAEPGSEIGLALVESYGEVLQRHDVDVLISGVGGDQVLGGRDCEPLHIADHLSRGDVRALARQLRLWRAASAQKRSYLWWLYHYGILPWGRFLRGERVSRTKRPNVPWLRRPLDEERPETDPWSRVGIPCEGPPGSCGLWQDVSLLATAEAVSSGGSLSAHYHHPLLSRRLIELMLGTEFRHRRLPQGDRVLQRRSLRGSVPDLVLDRTGKGTAQVGLAAGYAINRDLRSHLRHSRLAELGVFNRDEWHLALDRFAFGLTESLPQMYASICLELWIQAYESWPRTQVDADAAP